MAYFSGQVIFLKGRRIFETITFIMFCTLILTMYLQWKSKSTDTTIYENLHNDPYLSQERFIKGKYNNAAERQLSHGRPDLAKYIHLDLKGAPLLADKFYVPFFRFLGKMQMGVKGIVIEYEDTLPLEGNLANVSRHKERLLF